VSMRDRQDPTPTRFGVAPIDRITEHPDLLAEFVRDLCGLEPEDYAVSDEICCWIWWTWTPTWQRCMPDVATTLWGPAPKYVSCSRAPTRSFRVDGTP
jgi:hypothetical protein